MAQSTKECFIKRGSQRNLCHCRLRCTFSCLLCPVEYWACVLACGLGINVFSFNVFACPSDYELRSTCNLSLRFVAEASGLLAWVNAFDTWS